MLWHSDEHEALTEHGWDEARAREALARIVADAEAAAARGLWPVHPATIW
jgi:hypothetical protein